jgi:hypothetical protein
LPLPLLVRTEENAKIYQKRWYEPLGELMIRV